MRITTSEIAPRRAARAAAVTVGFTLTMAATPALAAPPDTWENSANGPLLNDLLFLVGVPLAIIAVITLLTYLPSLIKGQSEQSDLAFRDRTEWFGGPRAGVDAATGDEGREDAGTKGGASARW